MKVPNPAFRQVHHDLSLSRLQNEGSQQLLRLEKLQSKSIKATE